MIKFGTGGWRAIIADEFTKENIRLVVAGLCKLMLLEGHAGKEICVGYDRRFLSKESAHWAAEVLAGYGFHVFVVARSSPTPLIMFTVKQMQTPYGLAVTASHNPAIYNGIKVFTAGGRDADQVVTGKIEEQIALLKPEDVKSIDYDQAMEMGLIREGYPFNEYIDSILQVVDTKKIKRAHLRIAIDPMYGVSQSSLRTILLTCRCDVDVIHEQHDTLFGGKMPARSGQRADVAAQERHRSGRPPPSGREDQERDAQAQRVREPEQARAGGVTPQAATSQLAQPEDAGLICARRQGRHKYFTLANADLAHVLEAMALVAERDGVATRWQRPGYAALKLGRRCYDRLAGELGVAQFKMLLARGLLTEGDSGFTLTDAGTHWL